MRAYLSDIVLLYLDELIDWDNYFHWRRGEAADAAVDRAAMREVLETAAQICEEQEPKLRAGWEQCARLENGNVVYPPHIKETLDKLREAGLISFGVQEQYGGFELPASLRLSLRRIPAGSTSAFWFPDSSCQAALGFRLRGGRLLFPD